MRASACVRYTLYDDTLLTIDKWLICWQIPETLTKLGLLFEYDRSGNCRTANSKSGGRYRAVSRGPW